MGRNPAVGRQGPAYHAAKIPSEREAPRIQVTQIRSGIGHPDTLRRTLRALGLRHHQAVVELPNSASVRGMLYQVRHLVEVTAAAKSRERRGAKSEERGAKKKNDD